MMRYFLQFLVNFALESDFKAIVSRETILFLIYKVWWAKFILVLIQQKNNKKFHVKLFNKKKMKGNIY